MHLTHAAGKTSTAGNIASISNIHGECLNFLIFLWICGEPNCMVQPWRMNSSSLSHQLAIDHFSVLVELLFVKKHFSVQGCWMPSMSSASERPGESERRWGLRTDLRSRRSRRSKHSGLWEKEHHKNPPPQTHSLGFSRWQASHCNSVDGRLAHLAFRNQSAMLLNSY